MEIVERVLAGHMPGCEVRVFGSRATGRARPYSDLDLVVVGQGPIDIGILGRMLLDFEDSDLPFTVDVVDWHSADERFRNAISKDWVAMK